MSNLVFPLDIPGIKIDVHREPVFDTRVQRSLSGKELRFTYSTYPTYRYQVSFELLRANAKVEFQRFFGFFTRLFGQYDTCLLADPEDNAVAAHAFGVGTGTATDFPLQRTLVAEADLGPQVSRAYWPALGDGYEPIFDPNGVPGIFVGGFTQTNALDFVVASNGLIQFYVRTPGTPALTPSAAGGSLTTGTKYVRVSALGISGETLASTEANAAVTGPTGSLQVDWTGVAGATGYRVYFGTSAGGESVYFAPGNVTTYTITTASGTGGAPPPLDPGSTARRAIDAASVLTWTGSYYRRVRFEVDSVDATRIVQSFWSTGSINLISVKP